MLYFKFTSSCLTSLCRNKVFPKFDIGKRGQYQSKDNCWNTANYDCCRLSAQSLLSLQKAGKLNITIFEKLFGFHCVKGQFSCILYNRIVNVCLSDSNIISC